MKLNYIFLNLKSLINWRTIFLSFLLVFIGIMSMIILFPWYIFLNTYIVITVIIIGGISFFNLQNFKNSTLYRNYKLTNQSKYLYYIKNFFIIFIWCWIFIIIFLVASTICFYIGWFDKTFLSDFFTDTEYLIVFDIWKPKQFIVIFYQATLEIIILFAILFAFRKNLKSTKNYSILILVFLIIEFIWGGSFIKFFFYNDFNDSIPSYFNFFWRNKPMAIYSLSFINPFFAPSEIMNVIIRESNFIDFHPDHDNWTIEDAYTIDAWIWNYDWRWNILYIWPWMEIIVLFIIGVFNKEEIAK